MELITLGAAGRLCQPCPPQLGLPEGEADRVDQVSVEVQCEVEEEEGHGHGAQVCKVEEHRGRIEQT